MQQTERSENFPFSSQNFLTLIFAMSLMSPSRTDCFTAVARGYSTTRNGKVEQLILLSGLHGELLYHADTTQPDGRTLERNRDHLQSLTFCSGTTPRNPNPRLGEKHRLAGEDPCFGLLQKALHCIKAGRCLYYEPD